MQTEQNTRYEIVQFLKRWRNKRYNNVAILIAQRENENEPPIISYSKCNITKDKFNKELGLKIARDRIAKARSERLDNLKSFNVNTESVKVATSADLNIPDSIADEMDQFLIRSKRYFKTNVMKIVPGHPLNKVKTGLEPVGYNVKIHDRRNVKI